MTHRNTRTPLILAKPRLAAAGDRRRTTPQREDPDVIDADAAAVLTKSAKEIEKRALPPNWWADKVPPWSLETAMPPGA